MGLEGAFVVRLRLKTHSTSLLVSLTRAGVEISPREAGPRVKGERVKWRKSVDGQERFLLERLDQSHTLSALLPLSLSDCSVHLWGRNGVYSP